MRSAASAAESILLPIAAVVLALLIGAVLICLDGANPLTAYKALLEGALGEPGRRSAARSRRRRPLIFTGLAVIVGMKAGLFNIGAQGQLLLGAVFAAWVGYRLTGLPAVAARAARPARRRPLRDACRRSLAGVLKAYRGAHEVITTIMLNAILVNITEWLVGARGPFHDPRAGPSRARRRSSARPRSRGSPVDCRSGSSSPSSWPASCGSSSPARPSASGSRPSARTRTPPSTPASPAAAHHRAGDGRQRLPRRPRRRDRDPGRVRPLRGRAATSASGSTASPSPCWPGSNPIAGHPVGAAARHHARRPDRRWRSTPKVAPEIIDVILAIILLLVCAPIVVRWVLRLREPTDAGRRIVQLTSGWGGLMTPRARSASPSACCRSSPSSSIAYAFYYLQLRGQDERRAQLHVPPVDPARAGRAVRPARRAHRHRQHRHRGPAADVGAFTGFYVAAATGSIWVGVLAGVRRGDAPRPVPRPVRGDVADRPDHRRHGHQHLRRRHHVVPLHAGQAAARAALPTRSRSRCSRNPAARAGVLFTNTPIAYIAIVLVVVPARRAVPHPLGPAQPVPSASTRARPTRVGISVAGYRYLNMALAGGLAGLGGAFLSLEAVGTFERGMSARAASRRWRS